MRVAVISDIHGNLEALEAVLADIAARRLDAIWCLGDVVGYGPDPNECVARVRALDIPCVIGNHDVVAIGREDPYHFNPLAREAVLWTRQALSAQSRDFLTVLPERLQRDGILLVHGSPRDPVEEYVLDPGTARAGFEASAFDLCLVGHSHIPVAFTLLPDGRVEGQLLTPDVPLILQGGGPHRHIVNAGSVGQPRDGDPRAGYLMLDLTGWPASATASLVRLPYPLEVTQEKMRLAGLPYLLAERLAYGR